MKPTTTTNQEILLFTGTRFSSREFCRPDNYKIGPGTNSSQEELERACWAGLFNNGDVDVFAFCRRCYERVFAFRRREFLKSELG